MGKGAEHRPRCSAASGRGLRPRTSALCRAIITIPIDPRFRSRGSGPGGGDQRLMSGAARSRVARRRHSATKPAARRPGHAVGPLRPSGGRSGRGRLLPSAGEEAVDGEEPAGHPRPGAAQRAGGADAAGRDHSAQPWARPGAGQAGGAEGGEGSSQRLQGEHRFSTFLD